MKILTPEQNIYDTLKGQKVLFLENDNCLENGLEFFEKILIDKKIEHKVIFELDTIPTSDIQKLIGEYDCIVFMNQWVYDVSKELMKYMFSLKDKKIVVEVYMGEPTWYYKPDSAHDLYIYACMEGFGEKGDEDEFKDNESFYKLSQKAYWDYKNEFDR